MSAVWSYSGGQGAVRKPRMDTSIMWAPVPLERERCFHLSLRIIRSNKFSSECENPDRCLRLFHDFTRHQALEMRSVVFLGHAELFLNF